MPHPGGKAPPARRRRWDRAGRATPRSRARRAPRGSPASRLRLAASLGGRRFGRRSLALARDQRALALDAPAIAGERAVTAYHPVARHQDGELVAGAGLRDGAHRARPAERRGDLTVGRGPPRRDLLQGAPDLRLEGSAPDVERQIGLRVGPGDETDD